MNIPDSVKVFAHCYSVTFNEKIGLQAGALGRCCSNTLEIEIDSNTPESSQADTFLHEICEALKYQLQLELEHSDLQRFATGLLTVIRDNGLDFREPRHEN